jgi:phosphatidyl-myo-inositol dimannoside synthase
MTLAGMCLKNHKQVLGAATLGAGHGGIARVARMCARALVEAGHQAELVTFLDNAPMNFAGCDVRVCYGSKLLFAARMYSTAITAARMLYDSVGIARAHPRVSWLVRPSALWIHGFEVWEGLRRDHARAIRRADLVFANSHYTLDRHEASHGSLRTGRVCWLATEQDAPPKASANFTGPPTVLTVGRLDLTEGGKGHDHLLGCWPKIVDVVPKACLIIAGGGTGLEAMRDRVRASSVASHINVLGFVSESEMSGLFARAHVFAMPSRQEGFGIVYVEAMRHGVPVIASVHDAGQEINLDGETGFNVNLDRGHELQERLIELLCDPSRAAAMGEAGYRRWQQHFTYSRFADRFLAHWHGNIDLRDRLQSGK